MRLTDRAIKSIKPTSKDQFISDGGGLYLRVKPSGTKTFIIRNQVNGKTSWKSIGDYPKLTLLAARQRLERHTSDVVTICDVYVEFDKTVLAKYARPEVSRARFRNDVLPRIGDMNVAEVSRADIFKVIQPILDRGANVMANRTLSDLKHLFQFAVERGYTSDDPSERITRKSCGGREVARATVLSFEDIEAFLKALLCDLRGKRGMGVTTVAALYLCLLTGLRASEVLWMMKRSSGSTTTIVIEAGSTKSKRSHTVHLSRQSRAALKLCHGLPIPKDHRVLSHALRRAGATFTPHDLRRTFATRLSDLGVAPYIIEKLLAHQMSGVMAVYNRADYSPERAAASELWGRKVAELRRKKTPD
jgi:integrase